jgi:predicted TIM-barrel fold metal-dependent hydrolase
MLTPEEAAKELKRAVTELGLAGATIPSNGYPKNLGSHEYWPVYEMAQELDVPISFHGGTHNRLGFDDINQHWASHAMGHPFGITVTLAGMLTNRVYEQFPHLRTGYLEAGSAWLLLAMERFTESYEAFSPVDDDAEETLVLSEGTGIDDYLTELLRSGRMIIGCEGGEHDIEYICNMIDYAPFMYSSDFPHEVDAKSCLHEIEELEETSLKDEFKDAILGGNALSFYKL